MRLEPEVMAALTVLLRGLWSAAHRLPEGQMAKYMLATDVGDHSIKLNVDLTGMKPISGVGARHSLAGADPSTRGEKASKELQLTLSLNLDQLTGTPRDKDAKPTDDSSNPDKSSAPHLDGILLIGDLGMDEISDDTDSIISRHSPPSLGFVNLASFPPKRP